MKSRLIVAAVGVPLVLLVIIVLPKIAMAILLAAMCALAVHELLWTTGLLRHARIVLYTMLLAAFIPIWDYCGAPQFAMLCALTLFLLAVFAELLAAYRALKIESIAMALMAGIMVPMMLSSLVRLMLLEHGRIYACAPFVVAFVADGGAYFAGRFFGKHKLAPHVSPHKTIEGLVGGFVTALVAMLLYGVVCRYGFKLEVSWTAAVVYAVVGTGASVLGDLGFSAIKRQTGIKDYGTLLPGHGGVLDRFDSMVTTAPVIEVLAAVLPFVGGTLV